MSQNIEEEFSKINFDDKIKILSIDIGCSHLALALFLVDQDFVIEKFLDFNLIDITQYTHNVCGNIKNCKMYHTNNFSDRVEHLYVEHPCFHEADIILVEKQPPQGFVVIEQLIFNKFRDKTILIHPRSVHLHFKMGHLDYENRKVFSEKVCEKFITEKQKEELNSFERKHDVSDALLQCHYYCFTTNFNRKLKKQEESRKNKFLNAVERLETFRYIPRENPLAINTY
jgi:hypothetical protein